MQTRRLRSALEWTAGLAAAAFLAWMAPHVLLGIVALGVLIFGVVAFLSRPPLMEILLVGLLLLIGFAAAGIAQVH